MLGDLFHRLGATVGALDARVRETSGAGRRPRPRQVGVQNPERPHDEIVENAVLSAAGAWLVSRLLRPRPVRWSRVVVSGLAGSLLADLVGRTRYEMEAGGEAPAAASPPYADEPEELMARLGAGVAIAAGYAALVYPRLPGPPLLRGLAFGALEIAAAPRGGLVRLAADLPGVKFPLQALATPVDEDAGPLSHLVFGLTLGMLYRNGGD